MKTETTLFSGRVLVAEDIEGNRQLIELLLTMLGLEVVMVNDGEQAIEKALSESFDLILMDMQMPHMNGYDATLHLKQQGYKTPIVALTAHAMIGDDQKCRDAGCDGYLAKPINRRELPAILAKYLPTVSNTTESEDVESEHTNTPLPEGSGQTACPDADQAHVNPVIDWDELIAAWGSQETVSHIFSAYFKDIVNNYDELCQAVKASHFKSIKSQAHALKGVGKNLHVKPLYDAADQLEKAGRGEDAEAVTLQFRDLQFQIDKVIEAFSECEWLETSDAD
ncbi:MAG: response regulator [Planctomycetes bacterium]|nr:response regulator [Planctomycetota bacterium]